MKTKIISIIVSLICSQFVFSQSFLYKSTNPYGLEYSSVDSTLVTVKILFYDVDGDDDLDAILTGVENFDIYSTYNYSKIKYYIDIQKNIGTKLKPVFGPRKPFMSPFPYPDGFFTPAIGDLNHDHLPDFIVCCGVDSSFNLKPQYYERQSIMNVDPFKIIDSDSLNLNNINRGSVFLPELADMDMDGDLDILMSGFESEQVDVQGLFVDTKRTYAYFYAKNIGTLNKPVFVGWYPNPYGLIPGNYPQMSIVGDIDNDNDIDVLSLIQKYVRLQSSSVYFSFIENIPQPDGRPQFLAGVNSPFGLPDAGEGEELYGHALVDIDGDGDLDLFVAQKLKSTGIGIGYYENNLCSANSTQISQQICQGDSVMVGSQVFKRTGEHFVTFEKPDRCDSTVHLSLTVLPISQQILNKNICLGESYTVGNQTFDQSGQYMVTLSSIAGCDSIVTLNLKVVPNDFTELTRSICEGTSVSIGNNTFNQSGQYVVNLSNSNGCDSVVQLNLTVNPTSITNLAKTLCNGTSFMIGPQSFTQTGQYEVKLKSISGCDSIVKASLTFITLDGNVTETQNGLTSNQNGAQYQWFDCANNTDINGATGQTFTPTKNGTYGVRITDANNCQISSACFNFVLSSIELINMSSKITLFPNPTADYFTLLNNTGYALTDITILNNVGQIKQKITGHQIEKISTAGLLSGNYIIEMVCNGTKIYKKLTVVRD